MLTADVDDLEGTANDDAFTAGLSATGQQTLNDYDRLDGGEGSDTLTATLAGGNNILDGVIENIEKLYFRPLTTSSVDMANVAGVEQIWSDRAQDNFTVDNQENLVTFGVIDGEGDDNVVNYDVDSATAVAQDVVLQGANLANAEGVAQGNLTVNNAGTAEFNAINVTNSGESFFNSVTSNSLADEVELNVEGSGSLQIDNALAPNIDTVNTVDFTGDLTLDLSANASDLDVTLGAGDNTLTVNGEQLDANDSIDMGVGYNTLTLGDLPDLDVNFSGVTNVQALGFVEAQEITAGTSETLNVGDINKVTFEGGLNGGGSAPTDATVADLFDNMAAADTVEIGSTTYTLQADESYTAVDSDDSAPTLAAGEYAVAGTPSSIFTSVFVDANGEFFSDSALTIPLYINTDALSENDSGSDPAATASNYLAVDGAELVVGDTTYVGTSTSAVQSTTTGLAQSDVETALDGSTATFTIAASPNDIDTVDSAGEVTSTLYVEADGSLTATVDDAAQIPATLELDSNASELTVDFEDIADGATLAVSDDVSDLTLTADSATVGLNVTNQADSAGDTESLQTLTLADTSEPNTDGELPLSDFGYFDSTIVPGGEWVPMELIDVNGLTTLNLNGVSGVNADGDDVASIFSIDAQNANYESAVTVNISNVQYGNYQNAQTSVSETFVFSGDIVEDGSFYIDNFVVSGGENGDKLDFSAYGITDIDGLTVVNTNAGIGEYTITSDSFDGEVVVNANGTPEPSFFEANFIA